MSLSAPHPTPKLEDQVLRFVCPLPCDLPGLVKPARSISSRRYSSQAHWGTQAFPPRQGSSTRGVDTVNFRLLSFCTER